MKIKETIKKVIKDDRTKGIVAYVGSITIVGLAGLAVSDLMAYYKNKG